MVKKKKQKSGGSRMMALGKKPIMLWVTPDEHARIKWAAEIDRRPMTQFILHEALIAARSPRYGNKPD